MAKRPTKSTKRDAPPAPPRLTHCIVKWSATFDLRQADLVEKTDANKSTVSRWFKGAIPKDDHLDQLVSIFGVEERSDLFRDPVDYWITQLLRGRADEEKDRIRQAIEIAFPRKAA